LFGCGFGAQFDLATGAYETLPGQSVKCGRAEEFGYGTVIEGGVACSCGYFDVSRDLSFGDGADDAAEGGVALLVFA
jgi:hypothetical protein